VSTKKLVKYIFVNWRYFVISFLLSAFFVFLIFPILVNAGYLRNPLKGSTTETFVGITSLILILLISLWSKARRFWQRYRNTHNLEKPPFIYCDGLFLFLISSALFIVLFHSQPIDFSTEFKQWVTINIGLILAWFFTSYFWKETESSGQSSGIDRDSLSDEPIQSLDQDLLGRKVFIEDLYKAIAELPIRDSFVFGLHGSWGEGKTSVINLLRNKFRENEDFILVNFDPWYFKDEQAVLEAFYRQIEQAISDKFIFSDIKRIFKRYRKLITTGLSQAAVEFPLSFDFFAGESLDRARQSVESSIAQTSRKILIFIDDIDRLRPGEILLFFKLVRLNANFKNTIFLLAFDNVIVGNYLRQDLKADPQFLEKIVQKPVPLPAIEQSDLDLFIHLHIERLLEEMKIPQKTRETFQADFPHIYETQIRKLFKTLRHAKRYLHGLRSTLPAIKKEVNLYDFFILEIIRIFYPRVYNDIWRNPWFYIPLGWSEIGVADTTYMLSPFLAVEADEKYSRIKDHIEGVIKKEEENEVLRELLKTLFPVEVENALGVSRTDYSNVAKNYRAEKRLTHPEAFRKYFMLKVSPGEISDEFMEETIDSWTSVCHDYDAPPGGLEDVLEQTIGEIGRRGKLLEFFKKLFVFEDRIPEGIVPPLIQKLSRNPARFSRETIDHFFHSESEYNEARFLLLRLINGKISKSKIHSMLKETILDTLDVRFAVLVVLSCRPERGGGFSNIYEAGKVEELQDLLANRLKTHFIDEKRDIFEELKEQNGWGLVLYQWATNWMTFKGDNNRIVNQYVLSLIKDNPKKFAIFLTRQRTTTDSETWSYNLDELGRVYHLQEFQKLGNKFKDDTSLTADEREAIRLFLQLANQREDLTSSKDFTSMASREVPGNGSSKQ